MAQRKRYERCTGKLCAARLDRAQECLRHAGERCNDLGDYTAAEMLYRLWLWRVNHDEC